MTVVSARLPQARIIAVEMLRGPDHIAIRTHAATIGAEIASASTACQPGINAMQYWLSTHGARFVDRLLHHREMFAQRRQLPIRICS
jgi:hypothetical protein